MTGMEAYARLKLLGVFRTADASALLQMSIDACHKILSRLAAKNLLVKVRRGLWTWPGTDPYLLPEYLTAPAPSYVSLQTALYFHGMISQIPQTIYAITLARSHRVQTPLGVFSFHHLPPQLFFGFESHGELGVKLATVEKALFDLLYLRPTRSRLFVSLPEIDWPKHFDRRQFQRMIQKIPTQRRRSLAQGYWMALKPY